MKKVSYIKNILFTVTLLLFCLVRLVFKTFFPDILFPYISISMMVLISIIPEIIVAVLKIEDDGCAYFSALLSGLAFAIFPIIAGINGSVPFYKLFVVGTVVYFLVDYIYVWAEKRIRSADGPRSAYIVNGLVLYLAFQGFSSLIL